MYQLSFPPSRSVVSPESGGWDVPDNPFKKMDRGKMEPITSLDSVRDKIIKKKLQTRIGDLTASQNLKNFCEKRINMRKLDKMAKDIDKSHWHDFYMWLQGLGREKDHQRTDWKRQPLIKTIPSCAEFVDKFFEDTWELRRRFEILKNFGPNTLEEAYLYYKYVVCAKGKDIAKIINTEDIDLFMHPEKKSLYGYKHDELTDEEETRLLEQQKGELLGTKMPREGMEEMVEEEEGKKEAEEEEAEEEEEREGEQTKEYEVKELSEQFQAIQVGGGEATTEEEQRRKEEERTQIVKEEAIKKEVVKEEAIKKEEMKTREEEKSRYEAEGRASRLREESLQSIIAARTAEYEKKEAAMYKEFEKMLKEKDITYEKLVEEVKKGFADCIQSMEPDFVTSTSSTMRGLYDKLGEVLGGNARKLEEVIKRSETEKTATAEEISRLQEAVASLNDAAGSLKREKDTLASGSAKSVVATQQIAADLEKANDSLVLFRRADDETKAELAKAKGDLEAAKGEINTRATHFAQLWSAEAEKSAGQLGRITQLESTLIAGRQQYNAALAEIERLKQQMVTFVPPSPMDVETSSELVSSPQTPARQTEATPAQPTPATEVPVTPGVRSVLSDEEYRQMVDRLVTERAHFATTTFDPESVHKLGEEETAAMRKQEKTPFVGEGIVETERYKRDKAMGSLFEYIKTGRIIPAEDEHDQAAQKRIAQRTFGGGLHQFGRVGGELTPLQNKMCNNIANWYASKFGAEEARKEGFTYHDLVGKTKSKT